MLDKLVKLGTKQGLFVIVVKLKSFSVITVCCRQHTCVNDKGKGSTLVLHHSWASSAELGMLAVF